MKTIGVITSGGDSPGMNPCVRAVVREGVASGMRVLGFMRAYQGIIEGDFVELTRHDVSGLTARGGTILKTARCKEWRTAEGRAKGAEQLKKAGVEGLVVIGGDGSARGAQDLMDEHGVAVVACPGTIDNDIYGTDFTIGFHTAVQTAVEAVDKIRDTAESHNRLFLIEVMGRHSGEIAAAVGLACGAEEILIPEEKTNIEKVRAVLERGRRLGKSSSIVIVAEGDDEGGVLQIKKKLALEGEFDVRCSVLGHIQRGGVPLAFDRILGAALGSAAVQCLLTGNHGVMCGVQRHELSLTPMIDTFTKKPEHEKRLLDLARRIS